MKSMDSAVVEFLIECDENLNHLETDLAYLDATTDQRRLSSIVRAIHAIKGPSTFLGYTNLESLTHSGERLVSRVREGGCALTPDMSQALTAMVAAIRHMLERIEMEGVDGKNDYSELKNRLNALQSEEVRSVELVGDDGVEKDCGMSDASEHAVSADSSDAPLANEPVRSNPELDEAVLAFLSESDESLAQVECDLVDLEKNPRQETLAGIFRVIHTIKGTCSFLGYGRLERLTHVGESLLSLVRDGTLSLTVPRASALLSLVDAIRTMLSSIAQYRHDGTDNFEELKAHLTALQRDEPDSSAGDAFSVSGCLPSSDTLECQSNSHALDSEIPLSEGRKRVHRQTAREVESVEQTMPVSDETHRHLTRDSSIRVDVGLLDHLMATVGELVLTRNQVFQSFERQQDPAFMATAQRLNLITAKLQDGLLKTRMQPIGHLWNKFPRVVRDLALAGGKEIRVEMEGQETEFDKTLLELIQNPLTHLVRNSVDHGFELPQVREANGKPREGRLLLRAYHEGGQAHVEVSDDGRGIHLQRVAELAVARGVVTRAQVLQMREADLVQLIFLPGFSTSSSVTQVSGRGVGLDVVKTNLDNVGGTIDISTVCEQGTTFKLSVPLTLTITPALIVHVAQERFAIPQAHLLEYVRLDAERHHSMIEWLQGAWTYRWRGQLLPIIQLRTVLQLDASALPGTSEFYCPDEANIVLLQAGRHRFGLAVDAVDDIEEIVVKPLGKPLEGLAVYSGMTILGDGGIALILDAKGLTRYAHCVFDQDEKLPVASSEQDQQQAQAETSQTYVVTRVGLDGRVAIPVHKVIRIAEVKKHLFAVIDGQEVVQYHNHMFPVIRLSSILSIDRATSSDEPDVLQIVLMEKEGALVGIVVDHVIDILQGPIGVSPSSPCPGILSSAILEDHVTDLLDVDFVLNAGSRIPIAAFPPECQEM